MKLLFIYIFSLLSLCVYAEKHGFISINANLSLYPRTKNFQAIGKDLFNSSRAKFGMGIEIGYNYYIMKNLGFCLGFSLNFIPYDLKFNIKKEELNFAYGDITAFGGSKQILSFSIPFHLESTIIRFKKSLISVNYGMELRIIPKSSYHENYSALLDNGTEYKLIELDLVIPKAKVWPQFTIGFDYNFLTKSENRFTIGIKSSFTPSDIIKTNYTFQNLKNKNEGIYVINTSYLALNIGYKFGKKKKQDN